MLACSLKCNKKMKIRKTTQKCNNNGTLAVSVYTIIVKENIIIITKQITKQFNYTQDKLKIQRLCFVKTKGAKWRLLLTCW